ncbi:putative lysine decarboxylase [Pandoraea apista]|nr:putative lysine decarboxylase [Pandoraea apista]
MYGVILNEWSASARHALAQLTARQTGAARHVMPVGLIGPRDASPARLYAAQCIGEALAAAGIALVCGGKGGVMEAASAGAASAGGIVIGLLPEDHAADANPPLSVALPTGLGITRNALIARASVCLVAVGGGLGTLSEIALGLQWRKPVFTVLDAPAVPGAENFDDIDALVVAVATWLSVTGLPGGDPLR